MTYLRENGTSSFVPCGQIKLRNQQDEDFQIEEFSRLSLNSHHTISAHRSVRSNSSLLFPNTPLLIFPDKSLDCLSLGSRNRKSSVELNWKNSILGNMTFLNKSIAGKSSLYHRQEFNLHEMYEPGLDKQLSEKSCPVGTDDIDNMCFEKLSKVYEEGSQMDNRTERRKNNDKKFLKTKNMLRNLSSYLHKYIRHNKRCKKYIKIYMQKKNINISKQQGEQFMDGFIEWTSSLNLSNFQEYQRVWTQKNVYTSIYRQICYKYYKEDLFCDLQSSRLTSKRMTQEYIPQFVEGLLNPKNFTHFSNQ